MQGKVILSAFKDIEFKLEELDNKCYNIYPDYKIQKEDLDTDVTLKFKDVKDSSGNYVKPSATKTFDVLGLPKIFDILLLEPVGDKLNLGQTIGVKTKLALKEGYVFDDLKIDRMFLQSIHNHKAWEKIVEKIATNGYHDIYVIKKEKY